MGGLLTFRLFGFPVTIHGSFLLLIAFLAYSASPEVADFVGFALIALVAILIHELGHAVAARAQGSVTTPRISLEGWGGLTRYRLAAVPSRAQSILITAAGPLAGIAMGVVVLVLRNSGVVEDTSFTRYLFNVGLFTTFGWSVFNLFPIVPLDGGHIMAELLPGSPVQRRRRAAAISAVFGTIAAVGLWMWSGSLFGPIILGMLVYQNLSVFNTSRGNRVAAPPLSPREP